MKLFRQNKSKFWYFDHSFDNGTRIRQSTKQTDRSIARIRALSIIKEAEEKHKFAPKKTVFWNEYLKYASARKSQSSIAGEVQSYGRFMKFIEADSVEQVEVVHIERFITHLLNKKFVYKNGKEKNISTATINFYIRILKTIFTRAVKWKYIQTSPMDEITKLKFEPEIPRFLTKKEIDNFFIQARRLMPQFVQLFQFYLLTGLRRSEAINLQWTDIDFETNVMIVRKTKGKRPRIIPMLPIVVKMLMQRRKLEKPFPEDADYISHAFKRAAVAAGLNDISLHDLRRSFATYLAPQMSQAQLQQLMGHQDFTTTSLYYLGANSSDAKNKMASLEKLLQV